MKQVVKRTIGHFGVLIDHALRPYEPSPEHVLRRMVHPLCQDVRDILDNGTKNDAWEVMEGFSRECARVSHG
jgi:hypothetical protein